MSNKILFNEKARAKLQKGVNILADAVRTTLGPKGKAVVIDRGNPVFTRDGVTVANHIKPKERMEAMGAELVRQVASKTNDEAGDGTTTATILSQAILNAGIKGIGSGLDAIGIKKGIERGAEIVLKGLKEISTQIKNLKDMENIATISSRDKEMGEIIADVYKKIGKDGIIAVEQVRAVGLTSEIVGGLEIESGYILPHFQTNQERKEAVVENPYVLITTQTISKIQDIYEILESVVKTEKKSMVIVCDDMTGEALNTCVLNKIKGVMKLLVIKAPGHGDNKDEYLQDIACVTGATLISEKTGTKTEEAKLEDLGRCSRVVSNPKSTIFIQGKGNKVKVDKRADALKSQLKEEESKYNKDILEKRYARLKGGVGVIRVGTNSEAETTETHYRIEDAVRATKSALEEGVVIGAGMALVMVSQGLNEEIEAEKDISVRFGLETLCEAVLRPAHQVIENAGENADVILERIKKNGEGWNAATGETVDLLKSGIIDPHKVVRCALENAVSVMGLFLITSAVVAETTDGKSEQNSQL